MFRRYSRMSVYGISHEATHRNWIPSSTMVAIGQKLNFQSNTPHGDLLQHRWAVYIWISFLISPIFVDVHLSDTKIFRAINRIAIISIKGSYPIWTAETKTSLHNPTVVSETLLFVEPSYRLWRIYRRKRDLPYMHNCAEWSINHICYIGLHV